MLPRPSGDVIFKELSDGGVLFHTRQEVYFGLNDVGCLVWKLLPPATHDLEELCGRVHERYPAEALDDIRADVGELLDELTKLGLITRHEVAGEPSGTSVSAS